MLSYMVKSEHFSDFHIKEIACKLDFNRWVGSTLPFLLSAHHLIGAYFLTTEGDKRMRLLTRLYGILPWVFKQMVKGRLTSMYRKSIEPHTTKYLRFSSFF